MFAITTKQHPLSTHAEIVKIITERDSDGNLVLIKIIYREGQVVNNVLVELTSYNKAIKAITTPETPVQGEGETNEAFATRQAAYDATMAQVADVDLQFATYTAAADKIAWAEGLLIEELG